MVVNACSLIKFSLGPGNKAKPWLATNCKILIVRYSLGSLLCDCLIHNLQYSHNTVSSVCYRVALATVQTTPWHL